MKLAKRMMAAILTMVLALGLVSTALAGTVVNSSDRTFDVYQVFSGTQAEDQQNLGDVEWGTGVDGAAMLEDLKNDSRFVVGEGDEAANIFADCANAADVAAALSKYADRSDIANAFANVADNNRLVAIAKVAGNDVSPDLEAGYYLFVDTTVLDPDGENTVRNPALLQLTQKGSVEIANKSDLPKVDKEIAAIDGEAYDPTVEAGDANIGDKIEFEITGTLPSNYADFETYKYAFHDDLSAGLTYNGDAKVYVVNADSDPVDVTDSFTVEAAEDGSVLTVFIADLKTIESVTAGSKIVLEYTATLDADAVLGKPGNSNKVYLEYSNDPNNAGEGTPTTGKTPQDEVLVFTYELDTTKVDGANAATKLKDAEFVLYREVAIAAEGETGEATTQTQYATVVDGKLTGWTTDKAAATTLKSDNAGLFKVAGLDAGTYFLEETKAPAGYNLLAKPVKVQIEATVNKGEDTPALETLTIKVDEGDAVAGKLETGIVEATVVNQAGAILPETGGIGTTIFYVVGAALVLGAVVLLVTKMRMGAKK